MTTKDANTTPEDWRIANDGKPTINFTSLNYT